MKRRVNFVSLTPGTSFRMGWHSGLQQERILLYWLLRNAWGYQAMRGKGAQRVFQGGAGEGFFRRLKAFDRDSIDETIDERFRQQLERDPSIWKRYLELHDIFRRPRQWTEDDWRLRGRFISDLRHLLAKIAVSHLKPSLVILDEFQRFKDVLQGESDAAEIARALFEHPNAKTLLLSATPYKMYTLHEERDEEDHYADFVQTLNFLADGRAEETVREFAAFRACLMGDNPETARHQRDKIAGLLRRHIVRTERLASSEDRDGMLMEWSTTVLPEPDDIVSYLAISELTNALGVHDMMELWKSSAYLVNFMEGYKLKERVEEALETRVLRLAKTMRLLRWHDINGHLPVDFGNARLRRLASDVLDSGAWRLLWLPPSLPYYSPGEPFDGEALQGFTKRLIFSAWAVVPKAIASLLSYDVERRLAESRETERSYEARKGMTTLLKVGQKEGRLEGMPVFALMYPGPTLAAMGDPLTLTRNIGQTVPMGYDEMRRVVRDRVASLLAPLLAEAHTTGRDDQAWYWAAPILIDRSAEGSGEWNEPWWSQDGLAGQWPADDNSDTEPIHWSEHVETAQRVTVEGLGRPPDDLVDVVTELAVGAPGVVALRALSRLVGGTEALTSLEPRNHAASIAWACRNMFNLPESMEIVRSTGRHRNDDPYWRQVVEYCISGNFQAVLDEYVHLLPEWLGVAGADPLEQLEEVARAVRAALGLRTNLYQMDEFVTRGGLRRNVRHMRGHFALRFGQTKTEEGKAGRLEQVRKAFNSPFWPFVLASTSVGQEGLDFHAYCHAVVHWNLPSNPVDLEQREGRIHRYKGHAVRKNVASRCHEAILQGGADPWEAMFDSAAQTRNPEESELVPYWVFRGGAKIERHVLAVPLSKDEARHHALKRTLGAYRLAFGQPRQEDLVAYLGERVGNGESLENLRIDLSPPREAPEKEA